MVDIVSKVINVNDLPSPQELNVGNLPSPDQLTSVDHLAPKTESSALEAAGRGLEQGATLGFGDETNAALQALLNKATGQSKGLSILDDYRKNRDESRANFKAAEEAHPYISGAANLAGAVLPAVVTGGGTLAEEGLLGAAKTGAKYGAISGLGGSEADLTKGELGKAAEDTAIGGGVGAAIGPSVGYVSGKVFPAAAAGVGHLADLGPIQTLKESAAQGLQGNVLFTKGGEQDIGQKIAGLTAKAGEDVQGLASAAKNAKTQNLVSSNTPVDLNEWNAHANQMIDNLSRTPGVGNDERLQSDLATIRKVLSDYTGGAGEAPGIGNAPTALQAEGLLRKLGSYGSAPEANGGLKTTEGKELVNRLVSPYTRDENTTDIAMGIPENYTSLKELVNQSTPGLADQNAGISNALQASKLAPSVGDIVNLNKTSPSAIDSQTNFENFINKLPPDLQQTYRDQFNNLSKAKGVAETISNSGGLAKGIVEKVTNKLAYGGANIAGNVLYTMTPDAVKSVASRIGQMNQTAVGQNLSRILSQAADKDQIGRNALLFSLQQNPEYRQILNDMNASGLPQQK